MTEGKSRRENRPATERHSFKVRSFLAVSIPEPIRASLGVLTEQLRGRCDEAKWVEPDNMHLTVKFLGNMIESELQRLVPALHEMLAGRSAFEASLQGLGAFPDQGAPRVLWAGVGAGREEAAGLHGALETGLIALELATQDSYGYSPHVTLARARSSGQLVTQPDFFETLVPPEASQPFRVEAVTLFMSELTPSRPIYSEIARIPLNG